MIQRIQTIYWLLAAVVLGIMLATPFARIFGGTEVTLSFLGASPVAAEVIHAKGGLLELVRVPLVALAPLCLILNVVAIFLYKVTSWQIRLSIIAIVLQICLMGLELYTFRATKSLLGDATIGHLTTTAYMPLIALALDFLAARGVIRDRNHLRRMDRIR